MQRNAILLVEDNPDDVFFMQRALKSAEVKNPLHVVRDGLEAIQYLAGTDAFTDRNIFPLPLIVILDLKLPHKDGHEVLKWIREQQHLACLIVIMLTTSREPSDVRRAYDLHVNSYLVKPAGAPQLIEMIKALKNYWLQYNEIVVE